MPYIDRDISGRITGIYANPQREDHEFVEEAELCVPPLTKQQRITAAEEAICSPYKLTRTAIQMIVALADMRAEFKFDLDGTPVEETLADSFARNKTYRVARILENACIAAAAAIV